MYTVKTRSQPGSHLLNSAWREIIKLFPARESLVSDVPAGDGKIANLFLQCTVPLKVRENVLPSLYVTR
jgi:hypothetical protein